MTTWLAIVGLAATSYAIRDVFEGSSAYDATYATAKREGAIVTADDLRRRYSAKDDENAAPIIRRVLSSWKTLPAESRTNLHSACNEIEGETTEKVPEVKLQKAAAKLLLAEKALMGLMATLGKPDCDFKYDFEGDEHYSIKDFDFLATAARVFATRALVLGRNGQIDDCVSRLRLAYHLAHLAGRTPFQGPAAFRFTMNRVTDRIVYKLLIGDLENEVLRRQLATVLASRASQPDIRRPIDGELFNNWRTASTIEETLPEITDPDAMGVPFARFARLPGVIRSWQTRTLEACIDANRAAKMSKGDSERLRTRVFHLDGEDAPDFCGTRDPDSRLSYAFISVVNTSFAKLVREQNLDHAWANLMAAVVKVSDARSRTGAWPASVDNLGHDPFTGKALRYRLVGNVPAIYSLGPNGVDDLAANREKYLSDDLILNLPKQ